MANKHEKNVQRYHPPGKCKSKLHWDSTSTQSSWAIVEETNNSKWREDGVQSEPLDAAGGNVNSAATMELSVGAPEGNQK